MLLIQMASYKQLYAIVVIQGITNDWFYQIWSHNVALLKIKIYECSYIPNPRVKYTAFIYAFQRLYEAIFSTQRT